MAFTIRGKVAEIRWGYHLAARLGSWTLDGGVLSATVLDVDTFRVSQSPLTVVIGGISRPIDGLQIAGWTLTASICPQENSDVSMPIRSA